MWRQKPFPAAADSDQSFSDDEDFDGDSSRNCISLSGCAETEGGLQILSQLEKLRDANEANYAMEGVSVEKQPGCVLEDDVEIPSFGIESGFICSPKRSPKCCSDEEMISDDEENNVLSKFSLTSSEKKGGEEIHSIFTRREVTSWLSGNSPHSFTHSVQAQANQSSGGARGKAKPKFSLGCFIQKDEPSSSFTLQDDNVVSRLACELPESAEHRESRTVACSAGNNLADSEEEMNPQSSIACPVEVPRHGYTDHSMAELLDGLHERTGLARGINKSSRKRGQRMQSVGKRSMTTILDSEDEPMSMDSDSPGEEESDFDNLKIPPPQRKRHTLVDCFQEVLDASPWRDRVALAANPSGSGLFERLQQVMRSEKERELEFSNNLEPSGAPLCGTSCLHVLILSSYLDAKLIVCRCSLKKIPERLQEPQSPESVSQWRGERTVIFSPRIFSNVDLEVGKLICICPPWKEVQLMSEDERVLLSTYFSLVSV
ncbi:uncharacterized protein LOC116215953 isoform X2 [Punica granatum]|uniref:Uncharacterized protein LOC116215953 isoform X2 n=1 Tax=Punica granatum TaxID=22663 RepID=A0A6P8EMX7_PUNGR|nr:uncharacterized protein LOC116215953 isoform X2 [Punica granatum]